jgi:hypothetical protein
MPIQGTIRPAVYGTGFSRKRWRELVNGRPEFRRYPSRQCRSPFNGRIVTIPSNEDRAEVIVGNQPVGKVYWSMSDEPLVCVMIDESAMPLVLEWAKELQGEFHEESWLTDA